ncbi:c-type cytochrome [Rickettsiella massiliensis]|uniref:c-type cytochrome n=1 Tax=Rickettsiella massiliensis TaxID=676517 RepID=UPI00029B1E8B|nr:hypothetical protein [Rickettsiella massiliensis]
MKIDYKLWVFACLVSLYLIHSAYAAPICNAVLARCAQCHGVDGNAQALPNYSKLAGQNSVYFYVP